MDPDFKAKIEERMEEIPAPLAQAIRESGWETAVFEIGRKHSLHINDVGNLQNELILVLTGISHPDNFNSFVRTELGIDSEKANEIIDQINIQVNEKIKNHLKITLGNQKEDEIMEENSEDGIHSSEKNVLKNAGIKLGDEPDEPEISKAESTGEQFINLEEPTIKEPEVPVVKKPTTEPRVAIPDIAAKLENPAVFKGKSTNYLDPYREPVE